MNSRGKRSQLWVKLAISAGILLGLTLLIETITTYFFVYDKVITEEAFQEAERQEAALLRQQPRPLYRLCFPLSAVAHSNHTNCLHSQ